MLISVVLVEFLKQSLDDQMSTGTFSKDLERVQLLFPNPAQPRTLTTHSASSSPQIRCGRRASVTLISTGRTLRWKLRPILLCHCSFKTPCFSNASTTRVFLCQGSTPTQLHPNPSLTGISVVLLSKLCSFYGTD